MNAQQPQQQTRNLFEFFDDDARNVMNGAREEVARTKKGTLDAEHLLGAVLQNTSSGMSEVFAGANLDPAKLLAALDEVSGTGDVDPMPEQLPLGPGAQQTLQVALQAAGQMFHGKVRPEHLVLGMLQDGEGPLAKTLEKVGSSRDALGRALMTRLQTLPADEEAKKRAAEAQRTQQAQQQRGGGGSTAGMTESAQRVVTEARRLAGELRHGQVGTVHLLLALLTDADRMAHNAFFKCGVRSEDVRAELLRQLRAEKAEEPAEVTAESEG
ncbi:MAG: Clp protease N-terminal domain-containing protein [Planctomycetota bacterium]